MAKDMNDAGKHFPIWGTCLGMQEMSTWPFTPRQNPVGSCAGTEDVCLPLNFTADAKTSALFGSMPSYLWDVLGKENVTPNFHRSCLRTKTYASSKELTSFYSVLTTNLDSNGVQFVSSYEARKYPFFGVQFHPEKIDALHAPDQHVVRSLNATLTAQYFGNFLVQQASKNNNSFNSLDEEARFMINSYQSSFSSFYEYYCFDDADIPKFD